MSNSVNMEFSYFKEIEKAKKERWPFILPVGTMEYHSTHCPYGTDTLTAIGLAREVAKKVDCVVLPPIWYGVASYAVGGPETNTINVNCDTFELYMYDILKSLFDAGINRNIYLLIAHQTEDYLPMTLACMKAAKKLTFEYLDETKGYGWWGKNENKEFYDNLSDEDNPWNWVRVLLSEQIADTPGDHAGIYECSGLEYLYPGTIKLERLSETDDWFAETAKDTSAELGKEIIDKIVDKFAEMLKK